MQTEKLQQSERIIMEMISDLNMGAVHYVNSQLETKEEDVL